MFLSQMRKPHRQLLALVAFCYLCLSVVLPLQHTDHLALAAAPSAQQTVNSRSARGEVHARQSAAPRLSRQDRCAACEWDAANVSAALPAFTLTLTPPQASPLFALLAHTLHRPAFPASSRAPPLA